MGNEIIKKMLNPLFRFTSFLLSIGAGTVVAILIIIMALYKKKRR